jgi:GTPase SAR1 family protein
MNSSVSTMSGKIKLKIIFLGNQSVGKSSII